MSELTRQECLSSFQEAHRGTRSEPQATKLARQATTNDTVFTSILRWLAKSDQGRVVLMRRPDVDTKHR